MKTPNTARLQTAIHEASHAVIALLLQGQVDRIELTPDGGRAYVGSVRHLANPPFLQASRELIVMCAPLHAAAVFKSNDEAFRRCESDYQEAVKLSLKLCDGDEQLALELAGASSDFAKAVIGRPDIQRRIATVAAALAFRGRLNKQQIQAAITQADSTTTQEYRK